MDKETANLMQPWQLAGGFIGRRFISWKQRVFIDLGSMVCSDGPDTLVGSLLT